MMAAGEEIELKVKNELHLRISLRWLQTAM
jgi:hypothetical protein